MTRRSNRSTKINESTSGEKLSQNSTKTEQEKTLESFHCSHEMKRQLADALKEPNTKTNNKTKKDKYRNNNKSVGEISAKRGGGCNNTTKKVLGVFEPNEVPQEACKLEFANAVRNTLGQKKMDQSVSEMKSLTVTAMMNDNNSCDNKVLCDKNNKSDNMIVDNDSVSDLLKDVEIIEDFDDNTWEVVSSCDCSQEDDKEEYFHLVDSDDIMAISNDNVEADKENNQNNNNNTTTTTTTDTPKNTEQKKDKSKKKILVTRKYIGGPDFPEKLTNLGFKSVSKKEEAVNEKEEKPAMYWSGSYQGTMFEIEAKRRCGMLVTSVKATSESLLLGLTSLQGLIEATGLLSYGNFSVPNLSQGKVAT